MMRKLCICAVAGLVVMALSLPGYATGPAGVAGTMHDLSAGNSSSPYQSDEDQICVFCHTPHGGSLDGPLWNRSNPTSTWSHYTSASLSTTLNTSSSRALNTESLLCMSCHDGGISVYKLINVPNGRADVIRNAGNGSADVYIIAPSPTNGGANIGGASAFPFPSPGGDLTNDHPVSFSYDAVLSEYNSGPRAGELKDVTTASSWNGEGVDFFGVNNRVECSSCHDPHVDYNVDSSYAGFLVMSNSGSQLCFACHNK